MPEPESEHYRVLSDPARARSVVIANNNPASKHPNISDVTVPVQHMTSSSSIIPASGSSMRSAIHLGLSFCLVFLAFSVAQNSQTSNSGESGFVGLTILYGVFTVSNIISSFVIEIIGVKLCLFLGSLTYALYVAANVHILSYVLFASSAVIGFGAAILWTAQGAFISSCATFYETANGLQPSSTMGMFNGIFFSIFQVNQFLGNLLAATMYTFEVPSWIVFLVMTIICVVGSVSLLGLTVPSVTGSAILERERIIDANSIDGVTDEIEADDYEDSDLNNPVALRRKSAYDCGPAMLASLSLLQDSRMLALIGVMLYSGMSQSFIYGVFPPLVKTESQRFFVMSAFGAADALSSVIMGRLSDRIGRMPIIAIGLLSHSAIYAYVMFVYPSDGTPQADWLYYVLALGLGLGDGVFNTQIYAILGTFFEDRADHAFANFKLFQSGSTMAAFLYGTFITSTFTLTAIPLASLLLGVAMLLFCDIYIQPLSQSVQIIQPGIQDSLTDPTPAPSGITATKRTRKIVKS